ncbi:hypothetical protein H646_03053 [Francisella tularensis subsp. tularensis 79201237]|nr:hypothetical protein NE061598_03095 [Francisella tularensis subsp. tularensis NE061598]EKM88948.1 hypothetical protein B343_03073 [Francisella tularensis subsp. tularensis 80700075]EOA43804.1 hypothetical protein H646_03053 [Francisella tularensis subsp. tularensis 79201237]EOA44408.1 hypothetical protein H647_03088 [Francisella tularensis subsp. tularensis 80700069]EOA46889.1 hypothetical protein H643_03066 [Francisella tularensis subsp. tularensis 1378]
MANSTVMYGNFDIVSNYVPTLTRTYFMQSQAAISIFLIIPKIYI